MSTNALLLTRHQNSSQVCHSFVYEARRKIFILKWFQIISKLTETQHKHHESNKTREKQVTTFELELETKLKQTCLVFLQDTAQRRFEGKELKKILVWGFPSKNSLFWVLGEIFWASFQLADSVNVCQIKWSKKHCQKNQVSEKNYLLKQNNEAANMIIIKVSYIVFLRLKKFMYIHENQTQ